MEAYGPGEEALRAAAAAASREGNPEKLRGVQGMKPPPVSTSSSNIFNHSLLSLKLPNADYVYNLTQHHKRFRTNTSHLSNPF